MVNVLEVNEANKEGVRKSKEYPLTQRSTEYVKKAKIYFKVSSEKKLIIM